MYTKLLQYPSPKGILLLANHNWLLHSTRRFYGHSYLAPTPSITTEQSLGISLTKKIFPPRQICLTKIHYFKFGDQHPTYVSD